MLRSKKYTYSLTQYCLVISFYRGNIIVMTNLISIKINYQLLK